ncbi:hypothetical protein L211DRAFT_840943 [Terfezia boudieri ATCC MYA-4762]|uniref:Uncharacterized protein n=1 Tax=Terfezia boudieri ATCC MYA-4762 TaxID=1051890 RepID=A0A3N4LE68_9PEZI|nr:hypothetical protein L211DRAFT_840943 [Terfezia boudieri ATCC MYA-4762]
MSLRVATFIMESIYKCNRRHYRPRLPTQEEKHQLTRWLKPTNCSVTTMLQSYVSSDFAG